MTALIREGCFNITTERGNMKKSIIRRAIAAFIAAAMLAGCAAQDSGVLSSVGNSSATESNVSYVEDTSSVDENSEVTSVDSSVTESDTSSDTSEQEESNTSKQENTSKSDNTEKPADTTKVQATADTRASLLHLQAISLFSGRSRAAGKRAVRSAEVMRSL